MRDKKLLILAAVVAFAAYQTARAQIATRKADGLSTCVERAWEAHERGDDERAVAWLGRADEARYDGFCPPPYAL